MTRSKKYHDEKPIRERIASIFYAIPTLPTPLENFLVMKIIVPIEGKNPRWKHLGKNCPCLTKGVSGK